MLLRDESVSNVTEAKLDAPQNADGPMLVTFLGMAISVKPEYVNAFDSMLVTL